MLILFYQFDKLIVVKNNPKEISQISIKFKKKKSYNIIELNNIIYTT